MLYKSYVAKTNEQFSLQGISKSSKYSIVWRKQV